MDSLQTKTKQEEHNGIIARTKPTEPTKLADFCLKIKEDYLQDGLIMNIITWQGQEGTKGSYPTTTKQNRGNGGVFPSLQTIERTEYQVVCQHTLQAIKHLAWCTYQRENPRDRIFRHKIRSQDSEVTRRVLTEPTRTATRSCTRQFIHKG